MIFLTLEVLGTTPKSLHSHHIAFWSVGVVPKQHPTQIVDTL